MAYHSALNEPFYLNIFMGNVGNPDVLERDCQKNGHLSIRSKKGRIR
jgi:hypothetical protein